MHDLASSLPANFDIGKPPAVYLTALASHLWHRTAGHAVSSQTKVVEFDNGKLTIATKDAIWRNNLHAMRSKFIDNLRQFSGTLKISKITFVVDPDRINSDTVNSSAIEYERDPDIVEYAAVIQDDKLRETFIDAASCSLAAWGIRKETKR